MLRRSWSHRSALPVWPCLLLLLATGGPVAAPAGAPAPIALPDAASLPWHLAKAGSFAGTQFRLAQLYGDPVPELAAFAREAMGEGLSCVLLFELEAPQHPVAQWNFSEYQGGVAGGGDFEGEGSEALLFWRYDAARRRLGFWAERLRRAETGVIESDTLVICAEVPAGHQSLDHEHLPRSHQEGRILTEEERILVPVTAGFNWRTAQRALLVYDFQGALRTEIRLPNNTFGYRFADLDGDARREVFLSCYASGNGDSCARGTDAHSYWRVIDLEGRDRLRVQAGGFATLATTQPLRPSAQALPLVLASLSRSQDDKLRLYDAEGWLVREFRLSGFLNGPPLVADLDGDGAEDILIGLADGSLIRLDARLEERARWRYAAGVQPLLAADLTGDGWPELALRIGDELAVCDRELKFMAVWTGRLTERLSNPLTQVGSWVGADDVARLALVGLSPHQVGVLRLEPRGGIDPDRPWLAIVLGLLAASGAAIGWLALARRRLKRQLEALIWAGAEPGRAGTLASEQAQWRHLDEGLRPLSHHGVLNQNLRSLDQAIGHLIEEDTVDRRQDLQRAAAELRSLLPAFLSVAPLAQVLIRDELDIAAIAGRAEALHEALAALEAGKDAREFVDEQGEDLQGRCKELRDQLRSLYERVVGRVREPVLEEFWALLPDLRPAAAAAGAPLELSITGPCEGRFLNISRSEFRDTLLALITISLTRLAPGQGAPLRLRLAAQEHQLELAVETPEGQDGETTAARWQEFVATQPALRRPRRAGDALCLVLPLRGEDADAPRARGAAAGLLTILLLAASAALASAELPASAISHHFELLESIPFDPAAQAQLLCKDIDGNGADNAILLLEAAASRASWLCVQREQGHARPDSIPLTPGGGWSLLGAEDLDRDGRAEILLSRCCPDTLELHVQRLASASAPARRERLLALPIPEHPGDGCPAARFNQVAPLPAGDGFLFAYTLPGRVPAAGLVAHSAARGTLWQRALGGPARLEDTLDLDADGRADLILAVDGRAGGPAMGAGERAQSLDLDDRGRTLRSEPGGDPGARLRRFLLRQSGSELLGELRLLQPSESSAGKTRLDYRPAGGASPLTLEPTWRCQDLAVLDWDGDGHEEFVLATGSFAAGQAELIAYDRQLGETRRLALPGRPRALVDADFLNAHQRQLLVVLADDLLLLDRQFQLRARLGAGGGRQAIRSSAPYCRGKGKAGIALLSAGELLLYRVEFGPPPLPRNPAMLWILLAGGLGLALGTALGWRLGRRRGGASAMGPWRELRWQPRARLLGLLLEFRLGAAGPERLAALGDACRRAADGDRDAAARAAEALTTLRSELASLLSAWERLKLQTRARAHLRALLAPAGRKGGPRGWRQAAAQIERLRPGLCGLEERLAKALSASPAAVFQATLERSPQEPAPLTRCDLVLQGGRAPRVFFEPTQLTIVFENLIANARRAMENCPEPRLRLEMEVRGDRLRLLLEDSGEGIQNGLGDRIFEPRVTTQTGPDHGWGLVIVRDLMAAFGGSIALLPGPGSLGGARFELQMRLFEKSS
jgi:signal transduction histidine kinase